MVLQHMGRDATGRNTVICAAERTGLSLGSDLSCFLSAGPGGSESSSEELEGDRHRSAGHLGGLLPHHHVGHPAHSR